MITMFVGKCVFMYKSLVSREGHSLHVRHVISVCAEPMLNNCCHHSLLCFLCHTVLRLPYQKTMYQSEAWHVAAVTNRWGVG
jgi:hypothetical protein